MNSISRGTLLPLVTSLVQTPRSSKTCKILPSLCLTDYKTHRASRQSYARGIRMHSMAGVSAAQQQAEPREGLMKRIFEKYNLFNLSDARLKQSGYLLYESVADQIDHTQFFVELNMSDTFFSWFLITELHIWMLMVRTMAEKEDGKLVRNCMVEALWSDTSTRAKVLWNENPSGVRKQVNELSEQFNCAIIGYDEGVNGDDKVLAGAIWRRIFQLERNNPEDIEKLVIYVRKQIQYLDKLSKKDLLYKPAVKWLPLKTDL